MGVDFDKLLDEIPHGRSWGQAWHSADYHFESIAFTYRPGKDPGITILMTVGS